VAKASTSIGRKRPWATEGAQIEFLLRCALADAGRLPGNAREMRRPGRPAGRSQSPSAAQQPSQKR